MPALFWSPDGSAITVAALGEACPRFVDVHTGAERMRLGNPGECSFIPPLLFLPDGQAVVVNSQANALDMLRFPDGAPIRSFQSPPNGIVGRLMEFPAAGGALFVSPTGQWLASRGGYEPCYCGNPADQPYHPLIVWDLASGAVQAQLARAIEPLAQRHRLAATFAGDSILMLYASGEITRWQFNHPQSVETMVTQVAVRPASAWTLRWSADGSHLAYSGRYGGVDIYTADNRQLVRRFDPPLISPALSPDGRLVALFDPQENEQVIYQVESGQLVQTLPAAPVLMGAAFSPDGQYLAYADDGRAMVAEVASGETTTLDAPPVAALTAHMTVSRLVWSPDGQALATVFGAASGDSVGPGVIVLWKRLEDGAFEMVYHVPNVQANYTQPNLALVIFNPEGNRAALQSMDELEAGHIRLVVYDLESRQVLQDLAGFKPGVWINDEELLAAEAQYDTRLTRIHVIRGDQTIGGMSDRGDSAYAPGGVFVAQMADPPQRGVTVRHWQSGSVVAQAEHQALNLIDYGWSPDGRWLASIGDDGVIRVWRVTAQESTIEPVGQIGGDSEALAVVGQYLYLGIGPRVQVFDLSNPKNPRFVGQTGILPGIVKSIIADGEHLYILAESGFLILLGINNPTNPQIKASLELSTPVQGLAVMDGIAYIAGGHSGLQVIDVSDPARLHHLSWIDTGFDAYAVAAVGDYLYVTGQYDTEQFVTDFKGGLQVIEISNPTSPRVVGALDLPYFAQAIVIFEDFAYLASNGLRVIDISEPSAPRQVSAHEEEYFYDDLAILDGYAFLSTSQYGDIVPQPRMIRSVVDIRNPDHPKPVDLPTQINHFSRSASGRLISFHEDLIYTVAEGGLRVLEAKSLQPMVESNLVTFVADIAVSDAYAYIVNGFDTLNIINLGNPGEPTSLGAYRCAGCLALYAVAVADDLVYLGFWDGGIHVVDVRDKNFPTFVTYLDTEGGALSIAADSNYLYVIPDISDHALRPHFRIFDVQNPARPIEIGAIGLSGNRYSKIILAENRAYLSSEGRIEIIDLADKSAPRKLGEHIFEHDESLYNWSFAVWDKYAYIVRQQREKPWRAEFIILGLESPNHPRLIEAIPVSAGGSDLVIAYPCAYLVGWDGLAVVDISNPAQPKEVKLLNFPGNKIAYEGNFLYVTGGRNGLSIFEILSPRTRNK
jgi:WD40 repeat protein